MANPNNAVGTNGAFGGRTSVNALNDVLSTFKSRGIIQGWACAPVSGMTVGLGGVSGTRDVAIAEDNNGNKTTINNISGLPVEVALEAAPAANNRLDVIVAYVANPPQGNSTEIDNPDAVSVIVVSSAVAASPTMPTDAEIRSAITADGTAGSNAYYVILATVNVVAGATDITANYITAGDTAKVGGNNVDWETVKLAADNIDWDTMGDQSSYLELGDILICWGITPTNYISPGAAERTVSFPTKFADNNYTVAVTPNNRADAFNNVTIAVTSKTISAFNVYFWNSGSTAVTGLPCGWIAIGKKAS